MCKTKNIFIALFVLFFLAYGNAKADANQSLISKVSFGRAADVDILLAQKANPNATNSAGLSAVFIAAARSDAEAPKIISSLIKAGADVNFASPNGGLPIIEAVRSGNPQNVKLLIDGGAAMSVKDLRGNDLTKIAQNRSDDKIITLVQAGIAAEQKKLGSLKSCHNYIKQLILQKIQRSYL